VASVRRTSVAGTWYPDKPARLIAHLDGYLERARVDDPAGRLRAIVAPHAGLMYSGPVAAFAYNVARRHQHSAIVLVGPSHFISFQGVSIWPDGEWETPLGPVQVNRELAKAVADAGAFAVVLEAMAEPLAARITSQIAIPTIGIGASPACDGQVLVMEDMLGLNPNPPKFVREYAQLGPAIEAAVEAYARDVRERRFPGVENVYPMKKAQ